MVDKLTARRKRVDLNLDELIGVTSRFSLYDPPAGFRSPSGGFSPSGALNFRLGKRGGRTASRPGLTKQAERDLDTTMRQPGVREPRGKDPKAREPRAKEPRTGEPRAKEPRTGEPRAKEPKDLESRQDSEKQSPLEMVFALRRTQSLKQACAKFVAERQAEGESRESSPHALSLRLLFTTASRSGTPRALIHIRRLLLGETVRPELVLQEATALLRHAAGNAEHLWDLTSIVLCFADAPPTTFIKHYLRQLHSIL
ncbi:hypothetical protein GNI_124330 [Gregarina niphandrodes]|uniref:Uncharacterized protein n=1 Tax=Gregarina niphandrodes TaxID=110365 RepID=A0A023B271_GRENI|nr:hypothetical protein GNI_124330 [Gregarina niphandrodes]EZG51524.1 hypothetical protein GNI_124330 [Gregarina niphandrodes]|eukprot:XP_011131962.1 hypothetical protein GNI_124330 [Gregarina niphandrodes]